tara:strand:- start:110 stop:340 length:231 start_codon:yes stop_codon:yes gene_type:complete
MKESGNLIGGLSVFVFYVLISVFPSAKADCTDYIYLNNEFDLKEAILTCAKNTVDMIIRESIFFILVKLFINYLIA